MIQLNKLISKVKRIGISSKPTKPTKESKLQEFTDFVNSCTCTTTDDMLQCPVYLGWIMASAEWKKVIGNISLSDIEKNWGIKMLKIFQPDSTIKTKQWTNDFAEESFHLLVNNLGHEIPLIDTTTTTKQIIKRPITIGNKICIPDLETNKTIYEVKARSYTTPGTIGDKLMGAAFKYIHIPKFTGKPVIIVAFGFQEEEAKNGLHILGNTDESQQKLLTILKDQFSVTFMGASSFIKN